MNRILDDIRKDAIKCANAKRCNDLVPNLSNLPSYNTIENVYRAIGTILTLAEVAKNEGLMAMDDFLIATDDSLPENDFYKKIASLVTNGTDPELLEEIGTSKYWTRALWGYNALVLYIYLRGLLMIQAGNSPKCIEEVLLSVLTQKEITAYNASEYKWTEEEVSYKTYRIEFKEETTQTLVDYVNESFETMTDVQFKVLLDTVHNECMVVALPYLTDRAEVRLFENVSERLKDMYIEDAKFQEYVNEKALREILLQLVGNIIVAKK